MYKESQTTLMNEVSFFGETKKTGEIVNVKILPTQADSGIVFKRVDLEENNLVEINYRNIFFEHGEMILKNIDGVEIRDFELLLASLWGYRIDNAIIEIDNESLPYFDGTSEPFSFALLSGKKKKFEKIRKTYKLIGERFIEDDFSGIIMRPSDSLIIKIKISEDEYLTYDASKLPYRDYFSKTTDYKDEDIIEYLIISSIAIFFISGSFNKELLLKSFRDIYLNNK